MDDCRAALVDGVAGAAGLRRRARERRGMSDPAEHRSDLPF